MICPDCGHDLKRRVQRYDYAQLAGLDPEQYTVLLEDVSVDECACGQTPEIRGAERLQYLIGLELVRTNRPLRSSAIRFLRKLLGMRQIDFAELVGVTPECVSRWETTKDPSIARIGARQETVIRLHVLMSILETDLVTGGWAPDDRTLFRDLCVADRKLTEIGRNGVADEGEIQITPPWDSRRDAEGSSASCDS